MFKSQRGEGGNNGSNLLPRGVSSEPGNRKFVEPEPLSAVLGDSGSMHGWTAGVAMGVVVAGRGGVCSLFRHAVKSQPVGLIKVNQFDVARTNGRMWARAGS